MFIRKSTGPDRLHPRVLREVAGAIAKLLSAIYQHSWLSGEVPEAWRLADGTPIYKKGHKEDPGNYRPVSLTSVPGKVLRNVLSKDGANHLGCDHMARAWHSGE